MPRGTRPTAPTLVEHAHARPAPRASDPALPDQEPASGIGLRPEVLARVPRLVVPKDVLVTLPMDHRAGFIVSFVDGAYTIEMILDACAMRRDEAIAILGELVTRGIISLD